MICAMRVGGDVRAVRNVLQHPEQNGAAMFVVDCDDAGNRPQRRGEFCVNCPSVVCDTKSGEVSAAFGSSHVVPGTNSGEISAAHPW